MSLATASPTDDLDAIRAALKEQPDGVLDDVARRHNVSLRVVLDLLPGAAPRPASGARFVEIWNDLVDWGPVTFVVHTEDGVFEMKAPLPPGSEGRGYFNIHGESPLGGHLRIRDASRSICRPPVLRTPVLFAAIHQHQRRRHVKVFDGRDEKRELLADQLGRFERLRDAETNTT